MAETTTTTLTGLVRTAYSRAVEFAFQPQLFFAQFAQSKRWSITDRDPMPGDVVSFTIFGDLAVATSALSETGDPTAATMSKTQVSVTMKEYGQRVTTTQKLRTLSFANIDMAAARVVGDSMGKSVDLIARASFDSSTAAAYIKYASGTTPKAVLNTANCRLQADDIRYAFNRLARNNVIKPDGRFYIAIVHPDTVHDLRAETGAGAWRTPREYVDPAEIYNGEIGEFEGFRFVVTTNARVLSDGASGTVDLYTNYFLGYQCVGFAEGVAPAMGTSGPFDALQRLVNVYWYGLMGFGPLRAASMFKFYCSSSVGANT